MKRRYALLVVCTLLLTSCIGGIDQAFLENDVPSLTMDGTNVFSYDADKCQLGHSPTKHEFRIHTDNMSDYFVVKMDKEPTVEGENVKADLRWAIHSSEKKLSGVQFAVGKVGDDGTVWLWSHKEKIGVVVRKL